MTRVDLTRGMLNQNNEDRGDFSFWCLLPDFVMAHWISVRPTETYCYVLAVHECVLLGLIFVRPTNTVVFQRSCCCYSFKIQLAPLTFFSADN